MSVLRSTAFLILLCLLLSLEVAAIEYPKVKAQETEAQLRENSGMIFIPAGWFEMGSDDADMMNYISHEKESAEKILARIADEKPRHKVWLDAYYIDRHEVTVEEYKRCTRAGKCSVPLHYYRDSHCNWDSPRSGDQPLNCVSWQQAETYCRFAGKELPSEAQWEKAARSDDARIFPWGPKFPDCSLAVWGDKENTDGCGRDGTWPVCSKPAGNSPYGLCDVAGNLWEWVYDWYSADYYKSSPQKNPRGPDSGERHLAKGASWHTPQPGGLRPSTRYPQVSDEGRSDIGFRCARTSP